MTDSNWNPEIEGQQVRIKNNPSKKGLTTGKVRKSAGRILVEVKFGTNEKSYKQYEQLELYQDNVSIRDLLAQGKFGKPDDLRRILTLEKVKGELTNIFYSMEASNTDFYPYQFKPVLKFLDSPVSRLLIADEVGLGKTIESMYIWKELQAREDAQRLLIVCPAMLRDKWRDDLKNLFNIDAEIVGAKELLQKAKLVTQKGNKISFTYIASLEGLRVKNWNEKDKNKQEKKGARYDLARLLEQNSRDYEEANINNIDIFDFVIIDEAHYLRNSETANNKFAQLLRDTSKNLILLTATPIQIRSENLYQLLKLISPDDFFDQRTFEEMLQENKSIINALRLMWKTSPNLDEIRDVIKEASKSDYFKESKRFKILFDELFELENISHSQQVKFSNLLENLSLLGQFMTRNRKREVLPNRVQRKPQTLTVKFTKIEKQVYEYITYKIRIQALGESKFNVFRLMARQREMASCMVAALEFWSNKKINDNTEETLLQNILNADHSEYTYSDDEQEENYEIYGSQLDEEINKNNYTKTHSKNVAWKKPINPFPFQKEELTKFIQDLRIVDTKYKELVKFIKEQLVANNQEKFVLFAFYRNTLSYLQERLEKDGIKTFLIQGGMKREEKSEILDNFKNKKNISILLSSEVGSEGIDLQFCRFIINYDLPWNPMKVEQRIGRLDRLNQKHETISIVNYSIQDTIEQYILEKLYERIKIFENSIGDIEEIFGEKTEELILELLNPELTEEELKKRAEETTLAIQSEMEQQRTLEEEAMNLVAFSEFILNSINNSKEQGRWLKSKELLSFVADFFKLEYPGTVITPNKNNIGELYEINLSSEARTDLKLFTHQSPFSTRTVLFAQSVPCFFDPKNTKAMGKNYELIDSTHPLIQWIKYKYTKDNLINSFYSISASTLSIKEINKKDIKQGIYFYVVQNWKLEGLRKEILLAYKVMSLEGIFLSDDDAEYLINKTATYGRAKYNISNVINLEKIIEIYEQCEEELQIDFANREEEFQAENEDRCNVQQRSAKSYAERKQIFFEKRIEQYLSEGKKTIIPAEEGKLKKVQQNLDFTLKNIDLKRQVTTSNPTLATGLIFIED
ncbi:SNF2-related protein [Geminocystis sp. CENA526]|uniref:SNF2-related protein n=1 Tax=Geminocystis sp. CENA526 TaxID=1355871 RepID=UPI003D6E85D9